MRNQLNISIALIWFCEATHALKGQQLLAQGNALGLRLVGFIRPERAKALIELRKILELLPLEFLQYRLRSAELQASLALLSLARYFRANETN